jgi:signal transduction histidine kinase
MGRPLELEGRRKDGAKFPLEIVLTAINADSDNPRNLQFLGAVRDLTERNRMRAVLIQNEKLASIGLLSAGVAHEINNPLSFVGNNLAVLDRDVAGLLEVLALYEEARARLAEEAPELAERLRAKEDEIDLEYIRGNLARLIRKSRDGVDRVARIVHSLRGLARTDRPQRQPTHIPDLVDASLEMIRGRLKRRNVRIDTDYAPSPVVPCVSTQLSQVLLNLLVNAAQAIEAADRQDGLLRVSARRAGREMIIEVTDNGCGIPPEHREHIFDPFYTTKDVGEGTGLGLSISHNIITGHGGRIEVESTVGVGTTFRIYLPAQ